MCDADLTEEFNFLYSPLFVNLYLLSLTMGGSCFPHFLNNLSQNSGIKLLVIILKLFGMSKLGF